jgi:preprotein translocase subunit YajC
VNGSAFLILIVAFAFLWFVLIRPQKRRQIEASRMLNSLNVGDEVLTAGGIYGEVTELQDEAVMVRIAPGLEVRVARKAMGGVGRPDDVSDAGGPEAEQPPAGPEETPNLKNDG